MTTRALTGIWFAAGRGSRSTSSANASDPLVSSPTVSAFNPRVLPMATATSTPSTTAALRSIALRIDACTETRTVMSAASGARTGASTSVTATASIHASAAATPARATAPISARVGGVHATRSANTLQP